jgi:hypothetical protein
VVPDVPAAVEMPVTANDAPAAMPPRTATRANRALRDNDVRDLFRVNLFDLVVSMAGKLWSPGEDIPTIR